MRLKLYFIRKKLNGWSLNLKAEKKKRIRFQQEINILQFLHEERPLDINELDYFQSYQLGLDQIYLEEEQY
jgi:hypothetical protein